MKLGAIHLAGLVGILLPVPGSAAPARRPTRPVPAPPLVAPALAALRAGLESARDSALTTGDEGEPVLARRAFEAILDGALLGDLPATVAPLVEGLRQGASALASDQDRPFLIGFLVEELGLLERKLADPRDPGLAPLGADEVRRRRDALLLRLDPPRRTQTPFQVGPPRQVTAVPGRCSSPTSSFQAGTCKAPSAGLVPAPGTGCLPTPTAPPAVQARPSVVAAGRAPARPSPPAPASPEAVAISRFPGTRLPDAPARAPLPASADPRPVTLVVRSPAPGGSPAPVEAGRRPLAVVVVRVPEAARPVPLRGAAPAAAPLPEPTLPLAVPLALALAVGAFALGAVLAHRRARRSSMAARVLLDGLVEPELARLGAPALANAAKVARHRQDWLRALRYGMASLLVELEAWGILKAAKAATNRELARGMKAKPEQVAAYEELAGCFDTHWYGRQPVTEADWLRWSTAAAALREALGIAAGRLGPADLAARARGLMVQVLRPAGGTR